MKLNPAQSQSIADGWPETAVMPSDGLFAPTVLVCKSANNSSPEESRRNRSIDENEFNLFHPREMAAMQQTLQPPAAASSFGDREGEPSMKGFSHCDSGSLTANCTATQPVQPSTVTDRHRLEIRLANTSCPSKRKRERERERERESTVVE